MMRMEFQHKVITLKPHLIMVMLTCMIMFCPFTVNAQQEDPLIVNPEYVSWSRYRPGTWTEHQISRVEKGKTFKGFMTVTLVSVNQYKAVVSVRRDAILDGKRIKGTVFERDIMAQLPKSAIDYVFNPSTTTDRGQSNITINQRQYLCPWVESRPNEHKAQVLWFNEAVPGLFVRSFQRDDKADFRLDIQMQRFVIK